MHRITLERQQVWIYLAAIAIGLGTGSVWPALAPWLEALLWPTLMLLLWPADRQRHSPLQPTQMR